MYPSPLRDGGYDIADFFTIHPDYGTVDDFQEFVEQAHQRGIRVIADLVMNHTSTDHPWFQESRTDPTGPKRRLVRLVGHRRAATATRASSSSTREPSNWTFDPVRGQYYWHRFFHHQPDLNYDNPEVQEAMLERPALLARPRHRRLPARRRAVPLRARRGRTARTCRETHEYLKRVRAEIDARYPDRVLLAEANQWPEDVVAVLRRRRRVPHGVPLPGHAAHVHGGAARGRDADLRDPRAHARRSRTTASGASSCATTTS